MTDRELDSYISAAGSGDTEGLRRLYEELSTAVYRFALSVLREPVSAEDVMQETFIRVRRYAAGYKPGKPRAWVLTIARNLCNDELRRVRTVSLDELPEPAAADPADAADDAELIRSLLESRLTDTEREIVRLHIYGGLSHREISSATALSYSDVRWKYAYALRKLRAELQKLNA